MSRAAELLLLLQFNGGTFPTGGFSQSWGLETYVAEGTVADGESFRRFLRVYLESSIARCEGPVICRAFELAGDPDFPGEELASLEDLSNAVRVTGESRQASLRMGRAFARIVEPVLGEELFRPLREVFGGQAVSYPVLYGAVCGRLDLDLDDALTAHLFSAANTLTQSALKLIPLGNVEAQSILADTGPFMEEMVRLCRSIPVEEITNFCPGIDIASLRHEELPVRLYMS